MREQLERIERRHARRPLSRAAGPEERGPSRLEEALGGREVGTPVGACYEVKAVYRETYRHGGYRIGAFRDVDLSALSPFCGGGEGVPSRAEDFLFLDLETTGLSLGTGTYGFLVGLGYFRGGRYHIHQAFLRRFDEEPAFLAHIGKIMAPFRHLVTFNGKAFDIPLLEARFALHGRPETLREMASWDLLYAARRLWSGRMEDCRLGTIERERLGVVREGTDIAGEAIPGVYFRYIHEGDVRDLDRIVYHNAMDVLTMAAMVIHIDESLKEKDPTRSNLFSVGRYYERRGMAGVGGEYFEAASRREGASAEKDRALFHLAGQQRRAGRFEEAARIWRELIEREGHGFSACCVELAKHLEHRTRQYDQAIDLVLRALERTDRDDSRKRAKLEKRLARLRRKQARA